MGLTVIFKGKWTPKFHSNYSHPDFIEDREREQKKEREEEKEKEDERDSK